jgi:hypothetical protein
MIEQQFFAALSTPAAVTAICGNRIFPLVLPTVVQLPAIHYSFVGGSSQATQDTYGAQRYRVEVNCWGESYGDAVTLRHAVIAALDQYNQSGIFIEFLQSTDFFDHELLQYRAMTEFYVHSNFTA